MKHGHLIVLVLLGLASAAAASSHPLPPPRSHTFDPTFMSHWMGTLAPALGNLTLLDMSLPGTHDSMTWDLSDTISDHASNMPEEVANILHDLHQFINDTHVGPFIHTEAQSQRLNVTEQLDAGIRFFDFRTAYTAPPNETITNSNEDWYGMHMVQTVHTSFSFLQSMRRWIDEHPTEFIVVWMTRQGGTGKNSFDVNHTVLIDFWRRVETLFDGVLFNHDSHRVNETTYDEMMARNFRVIFYVTAFENFTDSSPYALSDRSIQNVWEIVQVIPPAKAVSVVVDRFAHAAEHLKVTKANNDFYLLSLASQEVALIEYAIWLTLVPTWLRNTTALRQECAARFEIPNVTDFCPVSLITSSQLVNYYQQHAFHMVPFNRSMRFPNAIYINAVDVEGTIRVGTSGAVPYRPTSRRHRAGSTDHGNTKGIYADALLYVMVRDACWGTPSTAPCHALMDMMEARMRRFPLVEWNDPSQGRVKGWPPVN